MSSQKYAVWRPSLTQDESERLEGVRGTESTAEALAEPESEVEFDSEAQAWNSTSSSNQKYALWRPSLKKKKPKTLEGRDGAKLKLEGNTKSLPLSEEPGHSNDENLFIPRLLDDDGEITSREGERLNDGSKYSEPIPSLAAYDGDITEEESRALVYFGVQRKHPDQEGRTTRDD